MGRRPGSGHISSPPQSTALHSSFPSSDLNRRAPTTRGSAWRPTYTASALPMDLRPMIRPRRSSGAGVTSCRLGRSKSWSIPRRSNGTTGGSLRCCRCRTLRSAGSPTGIGPGIGAPLAASTQPIAAEQGMQVAPRMKLPMTAVLRLDAPRRQLAQRELRATLDLYNTYDVATATLGGKTVPLEADDTAVLAYVLASPEIWERELKAFFSGVFSESTPTQLASIDVYRPGRIPVVFVHGTASSAGRWGDMVNDLLDDPRIAERYQFWFFTYDTGNPVLYSAALLREALRDAVHKLDPTGVDPPCRR